ncbi:MAG: hypothetical protein NVS4B3_04530 [Gemmatimonadaceae bacterium]
MPSNHDSYMTHVLFDHRMARRCAARLTRRPALGVALLAALAGCDTKKILAVSDPDVARPSTLESKSALPTLRAGALGDFGQAYSGPSFDFNQVTLSGLLSDELINTETFPTRIQVDQRVQQPQNNGSLRDAFYAINRARASSDRAVAAFAKYDPKAAGYAEATNVGGLALVLLAENYCSGVPISHVNPDGSFSFGPPLTTNQLLDSAIARFTSAQQIATAPSDPQGFVAKIALGRALLDQNKPVDAATAVTGVPAAFQFTYQHSETSNGQNNGVWATTASVGRFGVPDNEGINGLFFQSSGDISKPGADPRVANKIRPAPSGPFGFDGNTVQYVQLKYPVRSSPTVIADGVEGVLIQAEALLLSGSPAWLDSLNSLRRNAAVLAVRGYAAPLQRLTDAGAGLTGQAQTDARVNELFAERAFWLYLTSHRLGDLRRLIRQYGRGSETVFPTGAYFKGGTYGTDVNSPVPQAEQNNPSYVTSACQANKA